MADTTISNEISAGTLDGSEFVEIIQAGNNRKATTQDIANLIQSSSGPSISITATGGSAAATLPSRFGHILNVVDDFGADPTGTIDSTTAFNNALALAGTMLVPAGTYKVNANDHTIALNNPNTTLTATPGTATLVSQSTTADMITIGPVANNCAVIGLNLTRSVIPTGGAGINAVGTSSGVPQNCNISFNTVQNQYVGIKLGPVTGAPSNGSPTLGVPICARNWATNNFGDGIQLVSVSGQAASTYQWYLEDNNCQWNNGNGFTISTANNGSAAMAVEAWRGGSTFANAGYSLQALGSTDCRLDGLRIYGIYFNADGMGGVYLDTYNHGSTPTCFFGVGAYAETLALGPVGRNWIALGYISGTTLTVTTLTVPGSGTCLPTFAIGNAVSAFGASVTAETEIIALGTGTGGVGTYTVNNSQTVGSSNSPVVLNMNYQYAQADGTVGPAGATGSGFMISPNNAIVVIDGYNIEANAAHGIDTAASETRAVNLNVINNGLLSTRAYFGIEHRAGRLSVSGGRYGNEGGSTFQQYGVASHNGAFVFGSLGDIDFTDSIRGPYNADINYKQMFGGGPALAVGSWTPTDASGAGLTFTSVSANYQQIANLVFIYGVVTYPATADSSNAKIGGLPFTVSDQVYAGSLPFSILQGNGDGLTGGFGLNTTQFSIYSSGFVTNSTLSGQTISFFGSYPLY